MLPKKYPFRYTYGLGSDSGPSLPQDDLPGLVRRPLQLGDPIGDLRDGVPRVETRVQAG